MDRGRRRLVARLCLLGILGAGSANQARAQGVWTWSGDANVFVGLNHQDRKFTDFSAWESQNWFMLAAERPIGPGRLALSGMLSLEPFTIRAVGSHQVFQLGETFESAPLIDYQHPHDLLMELGARYLFEHRGLRYEVGADVVGSPALGPPVFMHRRSAQNNPQAPLGHHNLDSTHITPGVVRFGVGYRGWGLEGSVFRGEEPDENRLDIDGLRLNSWSMRATWGDGPVALQVSAARLHQPEAIELSDVTRITSSLVFDGALGGRPLAATLAWGQNREVHGQLDAYLLEWDWLAADQHTLYGRAEVGARDILGRGGLHPVISGVPHFHPISHVSALTLGYLRDFPRFRWGRLGIGADLTLYHATDDLDDSYGAPRSFHVFVRWRARPSTAPHVH